MGFLDKAKEKAGKLVESTKDKVDDMKDKRKADDVLDDLGRIVYRQRTGRGEDGDEEEIVRLVGVLQALEAEGTDGIVAKEPAPSEPEPAAPSSSGPTLPPAASQGGPTLPPAASQGGPTLPPAAEAVAPVAPPIPVPPPPPPPASFPTPD